MKHGGHVVEHSAALLAAYEKGTEGRPASYEAWHDQAFFHNHCDGRNGSSSATTRKRPRWSPLMSFWNIRKSKDTVLRLSPLGTRMASGPFIGRENNSWSPPPQGEVLQNRFHESVLPQPEFTETPRQFKTELKIAQMSSVRMAKEAQISLAEIHDYYDLHEVIPPEMRPRPRPNIMVVSHGPSPAWSSY